MTLTLPTVSVCCITYNHERYLAQAIESVLTQKTDFLVEMIIGEDCSPDKTRAVATEYERRYPGKVRVLAHSHNLGIMRNLMATRAACKGEFIAFLEGDDYWTDPSKLQRQVDTLRAVKDAAMCFHDAELVYEDVDVVKGIAPGKRPASFSALFSDILGPSGNDSTSTSYSQTDIARLGWFIPSASMLFRNTSLPQPLPDWFAGVFSGDYTLQLLSTSQGPAVYLPRQMSAYRQHAGGVMHTMQNTLAQNERRIWENEHYKAVFGPKLALYFDPLLEHYYFERSVKMGANGRRVLQLYYYSKAISINTSRLRHHIGRITRRFMSRSHPTDS